MNILVIDDDLHVGVVIARTLRDSIVVSEMDAVAGLARFVSAHMQGEPFDVVFCKVALRGMRGTDLLSAIRAHREPPVVIFLCDGDELLEPGAERADGVIVKPFADQTVREVVHRARLARAVLRTTRVGRIAAPIFDEFSPPEDELPLLDAELPDL